MSQINDLWKVDNIINLWEKEVKEMPLWDVEIITKLWDKKVIELLLNFGS